jgi:hypothetical protein
MSEESRRELHWSTVKRVIYAPGSQPSFPDGLYAEELIFDGFAENFPAPSRIEVCWDAGMRTIRLFVKAEDGEDNDKIGSS